MPKGSTRVVARFAAAPLVHAEHYSRIADAAAAERRIKGWSRAKKEAYIRGDYAVLIALAKRSGRRTLGPG